MPTISFLRVRHNRNVSQFRDWLLAQIAATFEAGSLAQAYCIISLAEPTPSGFALPPGMRLDASNSIP
jgi:hypothetical protein